MAIVFVKFALGSYTWMLHNWSLKFHPVSSLILGVATMKKETCGKENENRRPGKNPVLASVVFGGSIQGKSGYTWSTKGLGEIMDYKRLKNGGNTSTRKKSLGIKKRILQVTRTESKITNNFAAHLHQWVHLRFTLRIFQFLVFLSLLVVIPLAFNAISRFAAAVYYRMGEFDLSISVDKSDCYVVLWTRKNRISQQVIKNLTLDELERTNFNR